MGDQILLTEQFFRDSKRWSSLLSLVIKERR